ncbi:GSCFA domain-containing protein [Chryseolinea lacunae]|uniref:GSCFA domain-containing protein n=1 Tax=Chryseolinea lacunae TaxID=2801331 RepID=A0ABS1KWB6_9BACT|nr:GSCFA domain-containing protein [Chryseolinea lacunae]MBL0743517.1 GSCFA domain-containing protein [Chryseolinea lacunae]
MEHFRTVVSIGPGHPDIRLHDKIITLGSCFAHSMGERMLLSKMNALANPFGVIYNPAAIHKAIRYALFNESVPQHTFLQNQDVFLNYDFHSDISAPSFDKLQHQIKDSLGAVHYFLRDTGWLILTYGTAWVYERKDTGEIVANCHKVPNHQFTKRLLTEAEITASFSALYAELLAFNPSLKVILTVSPVRHVKDTLELNSVSKAILRSACHNLTQRHSEVSYFPAFEIMMDDLRDYRFYKADMIHPTEVAEDYIWKAFGERYFTADLQKFLIRWRDIRAALAHKPFHPATAAHQQFLKDLLKKLEELKSTVPVETEINFVQSQLLP